MTEGGCQAAGASIVAGSSCERREKLNGFAHSLGEIRQRWNDRFIPEREVLTKAYLQGRFEIVLNLNFATARHQGDSDWLLRIEQASFKRQRSLTGSDCEQADKGASHRYEHIVVFVDLVEGMKPIQDPSIPCGTGRTGPFPCLLRHAKVQ